MRIRFLINAESAEKLEDLISSHNLAVKKKFHVEKITVPENNSEVWRRICHGVQQKRSFNIVSSHETDMMDIPCPFTRHSCYATNPVQAPTGVLNTLEFVGFPRQQATLPSLELISGAMDQIPNFQKFLNQTTFEREMEGQEMYGIIIAALAENYVPVWSKSVNKYNLIKTRIIILGRSAKGGNCTFVVHHINVPYPQFLMKWH